MEVSLGKENGEKTNEQLVIALKSCINLLERVQPPTSNKQQWQRALDGLDKMLKACEKIYEPKIYH